MDIDHARLLAHTILHQEFTPVAGSPPPDDSPGEGTSGFHGVVAKALATYTDNASTLTQTTRSMADSALHTLTVVGSIDAGLAGDFHRLAGRRT
ncbi:hypothetical protein [Corynebacterium efficiens]|nr:hypothetical protein [Corynebacterium efficiens]